jgi:hypothetical protein
MADAHDRCFAGALRQRAASLGRTIALRSGGAFTGGLVMATTVTDDGVWEALRGWGWWMNMGWAIKTWHRMTASLDVRSLISPARKGRV